MSIYEYLFVSRLSLVQITISFQESVQGSKKQTHAHSESLIHKEELVNEKEEV